MNIIRALNKAHSTKEKPKYHMITATGSSGSRDIRRVSIEVSSSYAQPERKIFRPSYKGELRSNITCAYSKDTEAKQRLNYIFDVVLNDKGVPSFRHVETEYATGYMPQGADRTVWKTDIPTSDGYDLPQEVQAIMPELCSIKGLWDAEVEVVKTLQKDANKAFVYGIKGTMFKPYTTISVIFYSAEELLKWWNEFKVKL